MHLSHLIFKHGHNQGWTEAGLDFNPCSGRGSRRPRGAGLAVGGGRQSWATEWKLLEEAFSPPPLSKYNLEGVFPNCSLPAEDVLRRSGTREGSARGAGLFSAAQWEACTLFISGC